MKLVTSMLAAAFFLAPLGTAIETHAGEPVRIVEDGGVAPLTLTSAKQVVSRYLGDSGQRQLRVGRAEFDRDGNVAVEIVSLQGIAFRHVIVDAKSGVVADARTGAALGKKS